LEAAVLAGAFWAAGRADAVLAATVFTVLASACAAVAVLLAGAFVPGLAEGADLVTFAAVSFTFISGLAALLTLPEAAVFFTEGLALVSAGTVLPFFRAELAGAVVFEEDFAVTFLTAVFEGVGLLLDLVIVSSGNLRSTQTKQKQQNHALLRRLLFFI
jgi:hypothetical protein